MKRSPLVYLFHDPVRKKFFSSDVFADELEAFAMFGDMVRDREWPTFHGGRLCLEFLSDAEASQLELWRGALMVGRDGQVQGDCPELVAKAADVLRQH